MSATRILLLGALYLGLNLFARPSLGQVHADDGILEGRVSLYERANTAEAEAYLSEAEKSLILILNTARLDGPTFVRRYLPLAADTTSARYAMVKSRLLKKGPATPLNPAFGLAKSAAIQAADMGRHGLKGTTSSDGSPYYDRIHQQLPDAAGYASAYYIGSADPLDAVLHMLVADPDTVLAHMLLSPKLDYVGVAIRPHKLDCSNTVIDLARRPPNVQVAQTPAKKRPKTEAYFLDCPKGAKVSQPRKPAKSGGVLGWFF